MGRKRKQSADLDNKKQGSSLPLVICVAAFLVAFSLALVYTSGLLMSGANEKVKKERCRQLAGSFAKNVDKELKTSNSSFWSFANRFLDNPDYNEYNPDNPSTVYHYIADSTPGDANGSPYGVMKMHLYKELNEESSAVYEGTLEKDVAADADFTQKVKELQENKFQRYILTVEVLAECDDLLYTYATEYLREDTYGIEFSHKDKAGVTYTIVWKSGEDGNDKGSWRIGTTEGVEYNGWSEEGAEPIRYKYLLTEPSSVVYMNVHEESGMMPTVPAQGGGS